MKTENKTFVQIIQGFLSSVAVFLCGYLLSGRISIIEDIVLYPTGQLIFVFPFMFAFLCILIAKYSVKANKKTYFKTSIICLFIPVFFLLFSLLLSYFIELTASPSDTHVGNQLIPEGIQLLFILPSAPLIVTYYHMVDFIGTDTVGIKLILKNVAFFVPIVSGLIAAIKIYRDDNRKKV